MNDTDIKDLYQDQAKDQPPKALDDVILQAAQASMPPESKSKPQQRSNKTMWMAAASVALVTPLLLWISIQVTPTSIQRADEYFPEKESVEQAMPAPKPASSQPAEPAAVAPAREQRQSEADDEAFIDRNKITVTGSRIKRSDVEENMNEAEFDLMEDAAEGVNSNQTIQAEVVRNQALLKSEFKAKKQRLEKNTIADPMMALEWQQLLQHIEQGEKTKAQALLQSLQAQWPDYDYSALEQRIQEMD